MRGGGDLFISALLVNKRSLFYSTLNCFLGCIYSIYSISSHKVDFQIMNFMVGKKVVQVVQIGGRGMGEENLDKIQKNSSFFSGYLP